MIAFHAVLWFALGAATLAGLRVAHKAEVRTARLLAAAPRWLQDEDPDLWKTP